MRNQVSTNWIRAQSAAAREESEFAQCRSEQWWRLDRAFWALQARIWRRMADEWLHIAYDLEEAGAVHEVDASSHPE